MSILLNENRIGNFTSSEIFKLNTLSRDKKEFGKPALSYIKEKNQERKLGRSISTESNAKPLTWGSVLESRVFELLGLEYSLTSQETMIHPDIPYWSGSADGHKENTIIDIKCPLTLGSFCDLVDPVCDGFTDIAAIYKIIENHKAGEQYYWQLVSNAILNNCEYAELIVYMPYESEIPEIKKEVDGLPNCYWIAMATEEELPFIKDGGFYKNLNTIRFKVPESDKILLTENVLKAGEKLINNPSLMLAEYDSETKATIINNIPLIKI